MTGPGRTFVFAGPTLPAQDVLAVLPDAIVLPPIAATDLWPLGLTSDDTLAIIDGFFLQRRAIRHKEIVEVLDRGVTVAGASSMGALRAAELDDFGMVGVGRIYQWYVDGVIDGDDEVALVHGPGDEGYVAHTLALVNIRASLEAAVEAGTLTADESERVLAIARTMPFTRRDHTMIRARIQQVHGDELASLLDAVLDAHERDLKRADAIALLEAIRDQRLPESVRVHPNPHVHQTDVTRTSLMTQWRASEERDKHEEHGITPGLVLNCARILAVDYPTFHDQVAVAAVITDAVRECGAIAAASASRDDEDQLIRTLLVSRGLLRDEPDAVGALTDAWLTDEERTRWDEATRLRAFVRRVHTTGWRSQQAILRLEQIGRAAHWAAVAGRVERFNDAILTRRPSFRFDAIPTAAMREWCTRRWFADVDEVDDGQWWIALADRGFVDERHFVHAAQRIHPFALLRSGRYDDLDTV